LKQGSQVKTHPVSLKTPQGTYSLECPEDQDILNFAAQHGIDIPAVCRGGACSTCIGQLESGVTPDQSEQSYLNEADLAKGYLLLCVAFARGSCSIRTHCQKDFENHLQQSCDR
jgi:ferredoxin